MSGLVLLLLAGAPADAIIMRHDVARTNYLLLGDRHREVVAMLGLLSQNDRSPMLYSGMGTLIAPDWIVTAAHATDYLRQQAKGPVQDHFVFVKGRGYRVAKIVTHPQWNADTNANDIALIKLASPVREAKPACLYEGHEEAGRIVTLAGAGIPGDGLKGPGVPDGALLGATIRVGKAETTQLSWTFHAPGDPDVTPLEGISGPGDSGGPAFIGEASCLAGISSFQSREIDPSKPQADDTEGRYGAIETYTRVSAFVPWIRGVIAAS
ncbi:MAG TPA: trypsin-like serine protease [Allosphingosinicella sp.]|nr:trypsin-like serine protease [Allosphingosinicella sp.]